MPLLLVGLRKNTSLLRLCVAGCIPQRVLPTAEETIRCASGWMQELERVGYRNHFNALTRAPKESPPPRGVWTRALARVATLLDAILEMLRFKPNSAPSADTEGEEAANVTEETQA
jgi:hypothetical protein